MKRRVLDQRHNLQVPADTDKRLSQCQIRIAIAHHLFVGFSKACVARDSKGAGPTLGSPSISFVLPQHRRETAERWPYVSASFRSTRGPCASHSEASQAAIAAPFRDLLPMQQAVSGEELFSASADLTAKSSTASQGV